MARRKKYKGGRRSKAPKLPAQDLAKRAAEYLTARQFKDAIEAYKQLLKQGQDPCWQTKLAQAYLGRAKELAGKGMYKEAVVLWENMAHLCATRQGFDLYLVWLIRGGRYQRAIRLYTEAGEIASRQDNSRQGDLSHDNLSKSKAMNPAAGFLGGLLLTGCSNIAQVLPADEPLRQHLQPIQAALQAYCQGRRADLGDRLREIPFRSPFRDLRQILQALGQVQNDAHTARSLLAKIPADSAYARFAQVVTLARGSASSLMAALDNLRSAEIELIARLRGLTTEQAALLKGVQRLFKVKGKNTSRKALFQFVVDHRGALGEAVAERFCRRMLVFYAEGIAAYTQHFGPLSSTERHRISALQCEQHQDNEAASHHWEKCIDPMLKQQGKKDNRLPAALLLRHCVDQCGPAPGRCACGQYHHDPSIDLLEQSLNLDPLDKPAYLNLLQRLQGDEHRKQHDHWVERAVKHLPDDSDILLAAATAAQRCGAYSKASRFALDLVERDSINTRARQLLIDCQLAQLRKHIATRKKSAAKKSLATVQATVRDGAQAALLYLHRGFFALSGGDQDGACAHFADAFGSGSSRTSGASPHKTQNTSDLEMGVRLLVEGQCCGFSLDQLQLCLPDAAANRLKDFGKPDLMGLIRLLQHYLAGDALGIKNTAVPNSPMLTGVLRLLHKPLKAAAVRDYSEQELRLICDLFVQIGDYTLLKTYSTAALKHFDRPLFVLFQVLAKCKGKKWLSPRDHERLMDAGEQAEMEDDFATAHRITAMLDELAPDYMEGDSMQQAVDQLMGSVDMADFEQLLRSIGETGAQKKPRKHRGVEEDEANIPVQGELL